MVVLYLGLALTLLLAVNSSATVSPTWSIASIVTFDIGSKVSQPLSIAMNDSMLYTVESSGNLAIVNTTLLPSQGAGAVTIVPVFPFSSGGCCGNLAGAYGLTVHNGYAWVGATYNVGYALAQVSLGTFNSTVYFHGNPYGASINGLTADDNYVYVAASDIGIARFDQRQHVWSTLVSGSAPSNFLLTEGTLWFNRNLGIGKVNTDGSGLTYYTSGFSSNTAFLANASDGRIWFTENQANKIGVFDPSNSSVVEYGYPVGPSYSGSQDGPYGLTFDADGRLWVAGGYVKNLQVFDPRSTSWKSAADFGPYGVSYYILQSGGEIWGDGWRAGGGFLYSTKLVAKITPFTVSVDVGQTISLTCDAAGGIAPYAYAWTFWDGSTASGQTVSRAYLLPGAMKATCTATDGQNELASSVVVIGVHSDPTVDVPVPSIVPVDVGQRVVFSANVIGGSGGNAFVWLNLPTGCKSVDAPSISCQPTSAGIFHVIASATDSTGFAVVSDPLLFVVSPAPAILSSGVSPTAIDVGQLVTLSVSASGGAGALSYAYSDLPPGCSSTDGPTLSCSPTSTGTWLVVVTVSDANGITARSETKIIVNPGPAIASFVASSQAIDTGQRVTFTVTVSHGTGVLAYSYSGLPPGCSSENSPNLSCSPSTSGSYKVKVTVTDQVDDAATSSFNLMVGPSRVIGLPIAEGYAVIAVVLAAISLIVVSLVWFSMRRRGTMPIQSEAKRPT